MKFLFGITTYCRSKYLLKMIDSWRSTRSRDNSWFVVIADDGSPERQINEMHNWLFDVEHHIIRNVRRGIHHQVNSVLRFSESIEFDFAFRVDDDVVFKEQGWDVAYMEAAYHTGYFHLVHHDSAWKRVKRLGKCDCHCSGLLESRSYWDDVQGAFWTFNKDVVKNVGFIDVRNFNLCGFGHRDYTYRCCKAGFNNCDRTRQGNERFDCIWDLRGSGRYVELIKDGYESAPERDRLWHIWNTPEQKATKFSCFNDGRIYVGYCESGVNIEGQSVLKVL